MIPVKKIFKRKYVKISMSLAALFLVIQIAYASAVYPNPTLNRAKSLINADYESNLFSRYDVSTDYEISNQGWNYGNGAQGSLSQGNSKHGSLSNKVTLSANYGCGSASSDYPCSYNYGGAYYSFEKNLPSGEYTASVWVFIPQDNGVEWVELRQTENGTDFYLPGTAVKAGEKVTVKNAWQKIKISFDHVEDGDLSHRTYLWVQAYDTDAQGDKPYNDKGVYYLDGWKLERGGDDVANTDFSKKMTTVRAFSVGRTFSVMKDAFFSVGANNLSVGSDTLGEKALEVFGNIKLSNSTEERGVFTMGSREQNTYGLENEIVRDVYGTGTQLPFETNEPDTCKDSSNAGNNENSINKYTCPDNSNRNNTSCNDIWTEKVSIAGTQKNQPYKRSVTCSYPSGNFETTDECDNNKVNEYSCKAGEVMVNRLDVKRVYDESGGNKVSIWKKRLVSCGGGDPYQYKITNDGGSLKFSPDPNAAWSNAALTIKQNGNVGINDVNPAEKLTVNGKINALGGIRFNDGSVQTTTSGGMLEGMIMYFNRTTCPSGWSQLPASILPAGKGIYMVASAGAENGKMAQGDTSFLGYQENRPAGEHGHQKSGDSHGHTYLRRPLKNTAGGGSSVAVKSFAPGNTTSSKTNVAVGVPTDSSDPTKKILTPGTPAPYIQLLACKKN